MYFLYLDESGSDTSHFVLFGLAIPATTWQQKSSQITPIKKSYGLEGCEIHTGWMTRRYIEQEKIPNFDRLDFEARRDASLKIRSTLLNRYLEVGDRKKFQSMKKAYQKTKDYIHLTLEERKSCLRNLADLIGSWDDSRLFAEAADRGLFNLDISIYENAFSNVISRFDTFLENFSRHENKDLYGLVIQDNNESESFRLTELMKKFHSIGTMWTDRTRIIETPLFVDSKLTEMIQMVDLGAYATRRFFENNESDLFDRIYSRFDRIPMGAVVGIRHYTGLFVCHCKVCQDNRI